MGKLASGVLVFLGAVWTIGMAYVASTALSAYLRSGDAPTVVRTAQAPEQRWVRLEDARLRCDTRSQQGGDTFFLAEAPGTEPFLVQLSGDVPCDRAEVDGGFVPMRLTPAQLKQRFGIAAPPERDVRVFSQALAPRVLKGVLFKMLAFVVAGLAVLAIGIRSLRRAPSTK